MSWSCPYCGKKYQVEFQFESHVKRCPVRQKIERMRTLGGSIGIEAYNIWTKYKKFGAQSIESFMESRHFTAFMNFGDFYLQRAISSLEDYIGFMVKRDFQPSMWCNGMVFSEFVVNYDTIVSPARQWEISFDNLEQRCIDYGCSLTEIYNEMGIEQFAKMLLRKKVSIWYLTGSESFWKWVESLSDSERKMIMDIIQFDIFFKIANANAELHSFLKDLTKEVESV